MARKKNAFIPLYIVNTTLIKCAARPCFFFFFPSFSQEVDRNGRNAPCKVFIKFMKYTEMNSLHLLCAKRADGRTPIFINIQMFSNFYLIDGNHSCSEALWMRDGTPWLAQTYRKNHHPTSTRLQSSDGQRSSASATFLSSGIPFTCRQGRRER